MLTRFDNGLTLYSHNQLYGRWYVRPRGQLPNTRRSLRVALHTADHSALLYSASDIAVLDEAGLAAHPFLARVGPDLLDPALGWRDLAARLDEPRFRGRALGGLYLDQAHLPAGEGEGAEGVGAEPRPLPARRVLARRRGLPRLRRDGAAGGRRLAAALLLPGLPAGAGVSRALRR